jgi:phasin family protein
MTTKKTTKKTTPKMAPAAKLTSEPVEAAVAAGQQNVEAVVKASTVAATKGYEQAVAITKEQAETSKKTLDAVVKAGTEAATKGYEEAVKVTQDQVEKTSVAAFKGYDELAMAGKDNIEACVRSGSIAAKGMETLGKEVMTYAQASFEANLAAAKALMGAKTLREVIDVQTGLTRGSFDQAVAQSAKLTELSVQVTNDALAPIQAQANVNAEKLLKPVAA